MPSIFTTASKAGAMDRLRVLDALWIPTRYPDSLPEGAPSDRLADCKAKTACATPVRSLTQPVLRWPWPEPVLQEVLAWAAEQRRTRATLMRVGVFGSSGRGTAGLGSDLDLLLVDEGAAGPQDERLRDRPLERLPLSCDAVVLTPAEFKTLLDGSSRMATALKTDLRWLA